MNIISEPPAWNSVHRPIEYTLGFYTATILAVGNDGGKVQYTFDSAPSPQFVVGNQIYVDGSSVGGLQEITEVISPTVIKTDKDFALVGSFPTVYVIVIPEIRVYKGYYPGEPYETELPFELVASFRPQMTLDFDIQIDISGYLKSIFRILPPTNGIDFNMFNQFRISRYYSIAQIGSGDLELFTVPKLALNASIKTDKLNESINGLGTGVRFACGETIVTELTDSFARNVFVEDGDLTTYFSEDFNCDFEVRAEC